MIRPPGPTAAAGPASPAAPQFDAGFRRQLSELIRWRRDVRRFRRDPVPAALVDELLGLAALAPSVGFSQPWRFVLVEDPARRAAVRDDFRRCNAAALADYRGERAALYAGLKLAGLEEAPVHLAAFCDEAAATGHGLGRRTMPEALRYSVVTAVHTLWLAARAFGLGVGWVSILDPGAIARILDAPPGWSLVAYLCIGYPQEEHLDPELARAGWQERLDPAAIVDRR